ncbi:MAG TPA: hypothetical protein VIZ43_24415 [Trebonia sp.]
MSAAGGFLTPGTPHAELEQRYRRLLRLYPREFRTRRTDEMIGVLMAGAADGQKRPARADVSDILRGSLRERLRGPRGGWSFALSAFALVAPLFLVLTDILQVAFPYAESQAAVRSRISILQAHGGPAADILAFPLVSQHVGGLQFLSQPAFLILAAGHLIVAAAVLAGLRRTALAALVIAAAADYRQWAAFQVFHPGAGTIMFLTIGVFLLEAIALACADPRAARRREGWWHLFPALALAVAAQLLALSFDAFRGGDIVFRNGSELPTTSGAAFMVGGCVLVLLAVLLPLPLGLGWRASLLLAAACYPLVILAAAGPGPAFGRLPETLGMGPMPFPVAHMIILAILYLPPLLVLGRAVTQTIRTRPPGSGNLAA